MLRAMDILFFSILAIVLCMCLLFGILCCVEQIQKMDPDRECPIPIEYECSKDQNQKIICKTYCE